MFPGLEGFSYEEGLDRLGLYSMELRKLWSELIELYKMMRGIDNVTPRNLFSRAEDSVIRGGRLKMRGEIFEGAQGHHFH